MGRETVIITGMTIFNVENLLFCNNDGSVQRGYNRNNFILI